MLRLSTRYLCMRSAMTRMHISSQACCICPTASYHSPILSETDNPLTKGQGSRPKRQTFHSQIPVSENATPIHKHSYT